MHLNKAVVIGVVTSAGPKIRRDERGTPICSFWLDVSEPSKDGQLFHSYVPCEIVGKLAEETCERLEAGMTCLVDGKLKYRTKVDKDGHKSGGLILTSWYVTIGEAVPLRTVESAN